MFRFRAIVVLLSLLVLNQQEMSAKSLSIDTAKIYDGLLSNYDYTYSVNTIEVMSQGQRLAMSYSYLPATGDKPVVTLLHGKNFIADYWVTTADYLNKLGYGVLMPDQI